MRNQPIGNQKVDIGHLAEFLNIKLGNIDEMNVHEQAGLLQQLVALSQLKLTRLALRN
ncbi:MAG TPA: hypothetical protein VFO10_08890 [Oligoflexus sp.]|uniref:hypothetical protein n=1 Tax=Oligoflexus sp. TaxID=1971216 RepID=UPI002D8005BD|nr:hypothetical protein [Oligoflexus sp.]HET9237353.1 hypothetical protein [Oligoflexus sp.]